MRSLVINRNKILIAALSVTLYILLEISFVKIIQHNYPEFEKFQTGTTSLVKVLISYGLPIGLTASLLLVATSGLIYSVLNFLLVLTIYPSSILLRNLNSDYRIITLQVIYFFSIYFVANFLRIRVSAPVIKENQKVNALLFLSVLMIFPFVVIFGPHVDFKNLLLSNIYDSRDIETQHANLYTGYMYSPLSNVVIPLLMLLSIYYKKYSVACFAFGMLIFMFLVGGHKAVFFGSFLLVFFYFGNYYSKVKYSLIGMVLLLGSCIVAYQYFDCIYPAALFTRRVFFLPAILEIGYFDFFDMRPIFWSDSIFRPFVDYPYESSTRNLIGHHVLGKIESNANNGIISDGFMNFGFIGALLNIFMVSVIYAVLNKLNIGQRFFGLIFLMLFTFYSSYFFTSLFTHGVLILIVIAYFFLKDSWIYDN